MLELLFDTTALIDCRLFTELPFADLGSAGEGITIIMPRRILEELDHVKDRHENANVRHKARRLLRAIEAKVGDQTAVELRPGLVLEINWNDPKEAASSAGLRAGHPDDEILALLLARSTVQGTRRIVVSADVAMRMNARRAGVTAMPPPEDWLAEPDPDPLEAENRQLRREIQRLQSRLPRLTVAFAGGGTFSEWTVPQRLRATEEYLRMRLVEAREGITKFERDTRGSNFTIIGRPNAEELLQAYSERLGILVDRYTRPTRTVPLRFAIKNEGSAVATRAEVLLAFPPDVGIETEATRRRQRREREGPRSPFGHDIDIAGIWGMNENAAPLELQGNAAGFVQLVARLRVLMHQKTELLPPVWAVFRSADEVHSFAIGWSVHASEIPEPAQGTLHIKVTRDHADGNPG